MSRGARLIYDERMPRSPDESITVRRMRFTFPADLDPVICPGRPEESFINVGLSLLLPYLEPYLIRSMREARKQVSDPALLADLDAFNAQEGQHYRQHIRFNEAIRSRVPAALGALEAELDADYRRFSETRSLRWNLAYAEGFEALTTAMARFSFESGTIDHLGPEARDLFRWHLLEELEHRTVAFDVYQAVGQAYFFRLVVGLFAQWHLNRFVLRVARILTHADPAAYRARYGGVLAAWKRLIPLLWRSTLQLTPRVLATYLPWYSPHRIPMPAGAREMAASYTAMAERAG